MSVMEDTLHEIPTTTPEGAVPTVGWRGDPDGRHEYRYFVGDQATDLVSDHGAESIDEHGEWRPDPMGAHQQRYFVGGEPTFTVRDAEVTTTDRPSVPLTRQPVVWVVLAVAVVALLAVVGLASSLASANRQVDDFQAAESRAAAAEAALPDVGQLADDAFAGISGVSVTGDEESATAHLYYPYPGSEDMVALGGLLDELGFSSAVISRMETTAAIDGVQSAEGEQATVTWSYHPDEGLDVVIERTGTGSSGSTA